MKTLRMKASQSASNSRAAEAANVRISVRLNFKGLKKFGRPKKVEIHLRDTVKVERYFDYIRDEFTIDIYKADGTFVRSLYGETNVDCNRKYIEWSNTEGSRVLSVQYIQYYVAPDGFVGSLEHFKKWAEEGHLHGLIINL